MDAQKQTQGMSPNARAKLIAAGLMIGIIVLLTIGVMGCMACANRGAKNSTGTNQVLSPAARAYLATAMPALAKATDEYNAGSIAQAVAAWKAVGDFPNRNATDDFVSTDYLAYANDVRYYMVNDGSVDLKQLEDAKSKAETTIAAFMPGH